jgi:hypothetical protein
VAQNRKWTLLRIMGGEPTTHPDLFAILDELIAYKKHFSPETVLRLETNGCGDEVAKALARMPPEITILSTDKTTPHQEFFYPVNYAPLDLKEFRNADFSNACKNKQVCGMGFTPYGYYVCGTAGAIDRVFGFDIGMKQLPRVGEQMLEQTKALCGYCGFFRKMTKRAKEGERTTNSWREALRKYKHDRPALSLYEESDATLVSPADNRNLASARTD